MLTLKVNMKQFMAIAKAYKKQLNDITDEQSQALYKFLSMQDYVGTFDYVAIRSSIALEKLDEVIDEYDIDIEEDENKLQQVKDFLSNNTSYYYDEDTEYFAYEIF